jgi:hypothetical protein
VQARQRCQQVHAGALQLAAALWQRLQQHVGEVCRLQLGAAHCIWLAGYQHCQAAQQRCHLLLRRHLLLPL